MVPRGITPHVIKRDNLILEILLQNPPVFPSSQGDPWATTLPVWALLRERTPTAYKGQPDPNMGTLAAVTCQPWIDKPSSLTYPAAGRRQSRPAEGAEMASLYRRGKVWWVKSYRNGKMVRTSLKTTDKTEARRRMKEMESQYASTLPYGTCVIPSVTWETAAQDLLAYYRAYGTRNPVEAGYKVKHLTTYFTGMPLDSIDSQAVTGYVSRRRAQGMAAATINVELSTLRRALGLAAEHGKLGQVPLVRMLRPSAPRSGFLERDRFERVARALPDDLALVVRIGTCTGGESRAKYWP